MITAYVRCSDGPEGDWEFDVLPRLGERVTLGRPHGYYVVVKVDHYPRPADEEWPDFEHGVALRLLKIDAMTDPPYPEL